MTFVTAFYDHADYVRSGRVCPHNPYLVVTDSYDATIRLFDSRITECEMAMGDASNRSGSRNTAPVEQVLAFPSGTAALLASGPIPHVWDIVAGGRRTRPASNHQQTVTSLVFDSDASRALTGGLPNSECLHVPTLAMLVLKMIG